VLRALDPIEGTAIMRARRGVDRLTDLARGPGRLAQAMNIDRQLDGVDLCARGPLWLAAEVHAPGRIAVVSFEIPIRADVDNRILECAVAGHAHAIVTGDEALLALRTYGKVRIVTLREHLGTS